MLLFVQGSNRFSGKFLMFAGLKSIENGLFYFISFHRFRMPGFSHSIVEFFNDIEKPYKNPGRYTGHSGF